MCVGDILDEVIGAGLKFNLVKEHEFRVHIVANVPDTEQKFSIQFSVLIAGDVDRVQQVNFVLERNGPVGHIKERFLCQWVNRRNECHGDVRCVGHIEVKRDVGRVHGHKGGLVEVVPTVAVNVSTVIVVTGRNWTVREVSFFVGCYHDGQFFA